MTKYSLLFSVATEPSYISASKICVYVPHTRKALSNKSFIKNKICIFFSPHICTDNFLLPMSIDSTRQIHSGSFFVILYIHEDVEIKQQKAENWAQSTDNGLLLRHILCQTDRQKALCVIRGNGRDTWLLNTIYSFFFFNLSNPLLFSFFLLTYRTSPHTAFLAAIKSFDVGQVPFYPLKLCWHQNVDS